jgi:hypothetical protein
LRGGAFGAIGQPRQAFLVDVELEGAGGVERVLGVAQGELAELDVDLLQALLALRRQVGSVAAEQPQRLVEEALSRAGEAFRLVARGVGGDPRPEAVVERQLAVEALDARLGGVVASRSASVVATPSRCETRWKARWRSAVIRS